MIEMIMMKLGFSGMIAIALAATLVGGSVIVKMRLARKDIKIESLTAQVREVASERDRLLNANRSLTMALQKQNDSIVDYQRAAGIQQQRADRASKEAQSVKERWEAYTRELDGEKDVQKAYDKIMSRWNKPDTTPSEVP